MVTGGPALSGSEAKLAKGEFSYALGSYSLPELAELAALADALTQAKADGERMTLPVTALALVFLLLLASPACYASWTPDRRLAPALVASMAG